MSVRRCSGICRVPFEGGVFPASLGAVVHRTVLNGVEPAREVIHADDRSWLVGDGGVNGPNQPNAAVVSHTLHAIERNSSIAQLAGMPRGRIATRSSPGSRWVMKQHSWPGAP